MESHAVFISFCGNFYTVDVKFCNAGGAVIAFTVVNAPISSVINRVPISLIKYDAVVSRAFLPLVFVYYGKIYVIRGILLKSDFRKVAFACFGISVTEIVKFAFIAVAAVHDEMAVAFPEIKSAFERMPMLTFFEAVAAENLLVESGSYDAYGIT